MTRDPKDQDLRTALEGENRELRAYLKAFCAATVDPEDNGHDVGVHEANPFIEWEFGLVDEGTKPGRVITGGQVRRAMELVGFDKLKIEPAQRTISDELTEARDLRSKVKALEEEARSWRALAERLETEKQASPAQASDKAGEREGLRDLVDTLLQEHDELVREEMNDSQKRHDTTRFDRAYSAILALAPQPTGTEASRGVGADPEREKLNRMAREIAAATPTPPLSPDSTGPAVPDVPEACLDVSRRKLARITNAWEAKANLDDSDICFLIRMAEQRLAALAPSAPIAAPVRDVLKKAVSGALYKNQFKRDWREHIDPVVDAVLASLPAPASDVPGEAQTQEGGR